MSLDLTTLPLVMPTNSETELAQQIDRRRKHETHDCVRCGRRAHLAYTLETDDGRRWIDLCFPCGAALGELQNELLAAVPFGEPLSRHRETNLGRLAAFLGGLAPARAAELLAEAHRTGDLP